MNETKNELVEDLKRINGSVGGRYYNEIYEEVYIKYSRPFAPEQLIELGWIPVELGVGAGYSHLYEKAKTKLFKMLIGVFPNGQMNILLKMNGRDEETPIYMGIAPETHFELLTLLKLVTGGEK